jgi:DNA-directed RNA polymerase specialized sigma24 family protein
MGRPKLQRRVVRRRRTAAVSDTLLLFSETRERLARLRDDLRIALSLVVVDGLSYEEAAQRLEIPLSTYQKRLAKAREALGAMIVNNNRSQSIAAE